MKKIVIAIAFMSFALCINAQKKAVDAAFKKANSGKLTEAYDLLLPALENPESKDDPKTWFTLGLIFQKAEMQKDAAILAKTANGFDEAYANYNKTRNLDSKEVYKEKIKLSIDQIYNKSIEMGNASFTEKSYGKASEYFAIAVSINDDKEFTRQHDTIISLLNYYTGLSAYYGYIMGTDEAAKPLLLKRAQKHFEVSRTMKYNDDWLYRHLHNTYLFMNDTVKAEEAILQGYSLYPDSTGLIIDIVNLYIQSKQTPKALKYLDPAIAKDPKNVQLYFTKGTLYNDVNEYEKAEEAFLKALEIDPNHYNTLFNLGVLYYNWGLKFNNEAAALPLSATDKFEELETKRDDMFKKALLPLEKAYGINSKDAGLYNSLRKVYSKLRMKKQLDDLDKAFNAAK